MCLIILVGYSVNFGNCSNLCLKLSLINSQLLLSNDMKNQADRQGPRSPYKIISPTMRLKAESNNGFIVHSRYFRLTNLLYLNRCKLKFLSSFLSRKIQDTPIKECSVKSSRYSSNRSYHPLCRYCFSLFYVFRQYLGYFLFAKRVKFSAITTPFAILYQEPAYIHNARNDMQK